MTIKSCLLSFAILILVFISFANGQEIFNYQNDFAKILARTKEPKDNLAYEKLLNRFTRNDSTLSDFEVLALLIGFTDKPAYKPYQDLDKEREIYQLNGDGKFKEGLALANEFLATHPLSVKTLFEKSYSFYKTEQQDSADFYMKMGHRIFKAMWFSGNGKTKETPTFALGPADGQDYIGKFIGEKIGQMGSGRDKNGNFLDMLEVQYEDGATVQLYFIIEHAKRKMFTEEEKKQMEEMDKKGKDK
jgi:hypothetical protein